MTRQEIDKKDENR